MARIFSMFLTTGVFYFAWHGNKLSTAVLFLGAILADLKGLKED